MGDELDDMDQYIVDYHLSHGCSEEYARYLAWMNSNCLEMNGYFNENKDRVSLGHEVFHAINKTIKNLVDDKKKKGIEINHFEIMKGLYREMMGRYDSYRTNELQEIDLKKIGKVVYDLDLKWWQLP